MSQFAEIIFSQFIEKMNLLVINKFNKKLLLNNKVIIENNYPENKQCRYDIYM